MKRITRRILAAYLLSLGLTLVTWPDWRALVGAYSIAWGLIVFWRLRE